MRAAAYFLLAMSLNCAIMAWALIGGWEPETSVRVMIGSTTALVVFVVWSAVMLRD